MFVKLLTVYHLEFLSLKAGCTGSSESTLAKMPNCWKSHATAHITSYEIARMTRISEVHLRVRFLELTRKVSGCIPHILTNEQKSARGKLAKELLNCILNFSCRFL